MTLLVISPDYASHLLPLATLATAWRDAGERVVVASGPATAGLTADFGFVRTDLRLGRGSNPGVIRAQEQVAGEDDALRGFFAATRHGMVPTLRYQADARRNDLLWEPVDTARRVLAVVDDVRPDHIIVDHLAFSARLALVAAGVPHADVVLGHPSALPVGAEVYGYPPAWPAAFTPDPEGLAALHRRCEQVRGAFTAEWNAALEVLAPRLGPSDDAFTEHGDQVLLNYPAALHDPARTPLLPPHAFLGSAVRDQPAPPDVAGWLAADPSTPVVYVSFGSFLSVRADVLARVADALRALPVRVALAVGSADPAVLGDLPASWLVREFLPQVALLEHTAVAVTHGGNNSVTEALTAGVPMLVLPFSTDQFAGAAAVVEAGVGLALDPNAASPEEIGAAVGDLLDGPSAAVAARLGYGLRARPGREVAMAAVTGRRSVPLSAEHLPG
ncbi:nucleotide disphospho-sugar-binding domain-containing protein [Nakamurella sp.]|uniref:nucleotide disphospho-sugar-binding domain-containing protein n=1 Tax=Nakamurella sp. TaxID=1869182 RepID=UPI003783045F